MSFAGIKKPQDRVNLIVYLNEADGSPVELASAPAEVEVAATTESEAASETPTETTTESTEVAAAGAFPEGDLKQGKKVFRKCRACHKIDEGANSVGPSLWGVINRDKARSRGLSIPKPWRRPRAIGPHRT